MAAAVKPVVRRDSKGVPVLKKTTTTLFNVRHKDKHLRNHDHAELDEEERARALPVLRAVPLLIHLSEEGLEALLEKTSWRNFRPGEPVIAEGSRAADVFVVLSGELEVTKEVSIPADDEEVAREGALGKPSERLDQAALLKAKADWQPGRVAEEHSYAEWIDAPGLERADAQWQQRQSAHKATHKAAVEGGVLRTVTTEGAVLGEHAALFGRASASVWCRTPVETVCIDGSTFYEFVVLSPLAGSAPGPEWATDPSWVDAMLAACRDELAAAQVLGCLQARVEAILRAPEVFYAPGGAAGWQEVVARVQARTHQLQYALQRVSPVAQKALGQLQFDPSRTTHEDGRRFEEFLADEMRRAKPQHAPAAGGGGGGAAEGAAGDWSLQLGDPFEQGRWLREVDVQEHDANLLPSGLPIEDVKGYYPWHFDQRGGGERSPSRFAGVSAGIKGARQKTKEAVVGRVSTSEEMREAARARVLRMREAQDRRSLEKLAELLLHETGWLEATPSKARLAELKVLRARWMEVRKEILDAERASQRVGIRWNFSA